MLFARIPALRVPSRRLLRFVTTSSTVPTSPTSNLSTVVTEHEGRAWFLDLLQRYMPEIEARAAPRKAHASIFIRVRGAPGEESRYDPSVTWQALTFHSSKATTLLESTTNKPGHSQPVLEFSQVSISSQAIGSGVILMNLPGNLMWIFGPTSVRKFGVTLRGKYSKYFLKPEEEPELFRQNVYKVLASKDVFPRNWSDSLKATASIRTSLLHQLCRLPPFSELEFDYDQWAVHGAVLHGSKFIIRHSSQQRGSRGSSVRLSRTSYLPPHRVPLHTCDDFDHLLVLFPGIIPGGALRKIGLLSKDVLLERGCLTTDVNSGRVTLYVTLDGDFTGTLLEGLEDHFIDIDVGPSELEAFVRRHLDGGPGMIDTDNNGSARSTCRSR